MSRATQRKRSADSGRLWAPLVTVVGGATVLTMCNARAPRPAYADPLLQPQPALLSSRTFVGPLLPREPMGPFLPTATVVIPRAELTRMALAGPAAAPTSTAGGSGARRLAGPIGPLGPITGPLSSSVNLSGPITGPQWNGKPLPRVTAPLLLQSGARTATARTAAPAAHASDISSELPDERKVRLSELVNPQQLQPRAAEAARGSEVTPDRPLSVRLSVSVPPAGCTVGETVAVRMAASADCYTALIRVDTAGRGTVVFRSPAPSRSFACAVRSGPGAGAEYLVAIASVHPLNGAEVTAALRGSGAGFPSVHTVQGAAEPGTAWTQAVAQAGSLSGPAAKWQRFEWSVATGAFAVHAPKSVSAARHGAEKPVPARTLPVRPAVPSEGSALPAGGKEPARTTPAPDAANTHPEPGAPPPVKPAPPVKEEPKKDDPAHATGEPGTTDVPKAAPQ